MKEKPAWLPAETVFVMRPMLLGDRPGMFGGSAGLLVSTLRAVRARGKCGLPSHEPFASVR